MLLSKILEAYIQTENINMYYSVHLAFDLCLVTQKVKGRIKNPCYLINENIEDENKTQRILIEYHV